jgi:hypothetical protein
VIGSAMRLSPAGRLSKKLPMRACNKLHKPGIGKKPGATLLRVPSTDNHYTAAQEMLAWLFFQEGNYAEAARRYDLYADQDKASIVTDWWRLQFYLADYPNRKADFQALLEEVLDPAKPHQFASRAAELKAAVEAIEAENN